MMAFERCILKGFFYSDLQPDADFLMMALSPVLSAVGSVKQQRESRIVNYLQDFIQSLEDEEVTSLLLLLILKLHQFNNRLGHLNKSVI